MEHVASTMERLMSEHVNHRRLYLIQTYGIGKERVFIEVPPSGHQESSEMFRASQGHLPLCRAHT